MLIPFLALMRKDLRLFLSDRRAVLMSVVAPIFIASFFGYIFGGGAGNPDTSPIAVLVSDEDGSRFSQEIVTRLKAETSLDVTPATPESARDAVRRGKATAAVLIPKNFSVEAARAFLFGGAKPEIGMLYDPSHGLEMRMIQGIMAGAVMETAGKQMLSGRGSTQSGLTLPFRMSPEGVTSGRGVQYNGYAHSFGGMGIQFLLMVGVDVGIALLLLRERGVWKRMRAAPLSRGALLGSRAASSSVTSMATLIILFAFARVVFGVRIQGSMIGFLGVCAAFSMMTAAFGLLIATLGKTAEATRGIAILATLLMVMLGGAWVPTFVFPKWLQAIAVVFPTRWAMDGLDAVTWRGLGFSAVALPIALLFGCALVFGALAVMRFRWEAD
ncbi:MAG TPA: ABC transporter permease [Bryobacteraceae bacterium]|jgi:ABC-2 type transport system permease protein|nr:ABC transporter permease [Bryobacteraceae bacterium]